MDMNNLKFTNTDVVVCPHCGYCYDDSESFKGNEGELDCLECKEKFYYISRVRFSYSSSMKK